MRGFGFIYLRRSPGTSGSFRKDPRLAVDIRVCDPADTPRAKAGRIEVEQESDWLFRQL